MIRPSCGRTAIRCDIKILGLCFDTTRCHCLVTNAAPSAFMKPESACSRRTSGYLQDKNTCVSVQVPRPSLWTPNPTLVRTAYSSINSVHDRDASSPLLLQSFLSIVFPIPRLSSIANNPMSLGQVSPKFSTLIHHSRAYVPHCAMVSFYVHSIWVNKWILTTVGCWPRDTQ